MTTSRTYSLRELEAQLGLSAGVVRRLIAAGFVSPQRGPRQALRFTFQDMVLLRTASQLQAAAIPARKIVRSLSRLRASLPEALPLAGLRISAVGSEVVVREGERARHAETGQWLIDFEVRETREGNVAFLGREAQAASPAAGGPASGARRDAGPREAAAAPGGPPVLAKATQVRLAGTEAGPSAAERRGAADAAFERAVGLETGDPRAAERAYREAIRLAPEHVDAWLNLGVLLCTAGRFEAATALYREALAIAPGEPLLHYNLGVALEDLQRPEEALASYEHALALDGRLADAHFNAARLYETAGQASRAIRHYSAYRRLQRS